MTRLITTTLPNGLRLPAVPRGCTAFPAASYPADWRLHVLSVLDGAARQAHAAGTDAAYLNAYAAAAMEHGADVFAYVDDPTDECAQVPATERVA